MHYVRDFSHPDQPPPVRQTGPVQWLRKNLFSGLASSVMTLLAGLFLLSVLPGLFRWAFVDAVWNAGNGEACNVPGAGACWAYVEAKFGQFVYGRYPAEERWRPDLVFGLGGCGLLWLMIPRTPARGIVTVWMLLLFPLVAFALLRGGAYGLPLVETAEWGGLLLTIVVAATGMTASLPLGVLLALARRSQMSLVRMFAILFIELWRGVPLITVLFMASVMLPLFLPEGTSVDKLLRALIGVSLFSSAYMAEVVRGGLQVVPKGQYEAAKALGMTYWSTHVFIVLPQALRIVIPGIVNNFIGLFKDTTLVLVIGLFDLLGVVQASLQDANWASSQTAVTGYVFVAMVFWVFCFGMSRYALFMEKDTGAGRN